MIARFDTSCRLSCYAQIDLLLHNRIVFHCVRHGDNLLRSIPRYDFLVLLRLSSGLEGKGFLFFVFNEFLWRRITNRTEHAKKMKKKKTIKDDFLKIKSGKAVKYVKVHPWVNPNKKAPYLDQDGFCVYCIAILHKFHPLFRSTPPFPA